MKIKRNKKAGRYMSLYRNNFGFREPYQVLLDGTFCQVALQNKVNIQEQLPKYIGGECKLLTTACVIEETKKLGKPLHGAYTILSQFATHNCGHEKPLSASKCLSSFVAVDRNRNHYLIATQDYQLRQKVSRIVICPLIKLANNALVIEKPTDKIQTKVDKRHHVIANNIKRYDKEILERLQEDLGVKKEVQEETERPKKRIGRKGPNPLSCKKPSKKPDVKSQNTDSESAEKKKRRRHKVRIPRHVRKLLDETNVSKKIDD